MAPENILFGAGRVQDTPTSLINTPIHRHSSGCRAWLVCLNPLRPFRPLRPLRLVNGIL